MLIELRIEKSCHTQIRHRNVIALSDAIRNKVKDQHEVQRPSCDRGRDSLGLRRPVQDGMGTGRQVRTPTQVEERTFRCPR